MLCSAEPFLCVVGCIWFLYEHYIVAFLEGKLKGGAVSSLAFVYVCLEYFQRSPRGGSILRDAHLRGRIVIRRILLGD